MGSQSVKRAYRYRFYPTSEQAEMLNRTFGCVRFVYNRALEVRTRAWATEGRRVNYPQTSAMLTEWKRDAEMAFLNEVAAVPLQQSLRHLQAAFSNFYRKTARYPRFKSRRGGRQAAEFTRSAFRYRDGELWLTKMSAPLDVRWSRPLPDGAEPSTVTVSRDSGGRWHVSLLCVSVVHDGPETGVSVGVDLGITTLVTLSTGEKIANPRHARKDHARLARAQRAMFRKQEGSKNRAKARRRAGRVFARIADRRHDLLHKLSSRLVAENQRVVIEDLAVQNMSSNHALARAISDTGWRDFRRMLEYKSQWYGRELVVIDRFYPSSKTCSVCGALQAKMPLNVRDWSCACGATHDRDVNAAKNILAAGLAVAACGDGVRPTGVSAPVGVCP